MHCSWIRRSAVGLIAVAALAPTAAFASTAATSTATIVISRVGLPDSFSFTYDSCSSGTPTASYSHVVGPATPPRGTGSLAVTLGDSTAATLDIGDEASNPTASEINALTVGSDATSAAYLDYILKFRETDSSTDFIDVSLPATTGWQTTNILTSTANIEHNGAAGFSQSSGEVKTYLADNPGAVLIQHQIQVANCSISGADTADIDDIVVGLGSNTTTYDFETPASTKVTISAPKTAKADATFKVTGQMTSGGEPLTSSSALLLAEPAGSNAYSAVAEVTSDNTGKLTASIEAAADTKYEWQWPGTDANFAATSPATSVTVTRGITLHVASTSLAKGQDLTAWGSVTPATPKTKVTVYSVVGKKARKLGTATVQSDGSWGFAHPLPKGRQQIRATVAATASNGAGTSASITVRSK